MMQRSAAGVLLVTATTRAATQVWNNVKLVEWSNLASEEASSSEVKNNINDLVERRADAHVLLSIKPRRLCCLWILHLQALR